MSNLGIYIEIKKGKIQKNVKEVVSLAKSSGNTIFGVIFTNEFQNFKDELNGFDKIINVKGDSLVFHPDSFSETIAEIIKEHDMEYFMGSYSFKAKEIFPRIAGKLDECSLVNDCVNYDFGSAIAIKPVYSGKLLKEIEIKNKLKLITLRSNVFPVVDLDAGSPELIEKTISDKIRSKVINVKKSESKSIDIMDADIIVSGGRGMKEKENFQILEGLASILNAGVGASRAAVDSEFASYNMQVGQTGKVVNPKLYIAIGISGAIQHFVGMKTSKIIVAINKDSEAPIFKKADYGIIGDLFKIVPMLKDELEKVL
ncbi:MAG: electron transfer flavoprotein subunit alpha/FixB family protein [Candidatus Aminicenantes bacterium]|nr:electron transfer flavoprotein subunit alpha/FixB family protein [Candidatus Aminicenantes bacterium]